MINSKRRVSIYYGKIKDESQIDIELDKNNRFIECFPKPIDCTIIEIKEKDGLPEDIFLVPDNSYNTEKSYDNYLNDNYYLAGYKYGSNNLIKQISSGKIIKIDKKNKYCFYHNLNTSKGQSGSPICLINNQSVVGFHIGGFSKHFINQGVFVGEIIKKIEETIMHYYCLKNINSSIEKNDFNLFEYMSFFEDDIDNKFYENTPKNNDISTINKTNNDILPCFDCKFSKAIYFCTHCNLNLCKDCHDFIRRFSKSGEHSFIKIDEDEERIRSSLISLSNKKGNLNKK
jgi:hypothetical protein